MNLGSGTSSDTNISYQMYRMLGNKKTEKEAYGKSGVRYRQKTIFDFVHVVSTSDVVNRREYWDGSRASFLEDYGREGRSGGSIGIEKKPN